MCGAARGTRRSGTPCRRTVSLQTQGAQPHFGCLPEGGCRTDAVLRDRSSFLSALSERMNARRHSPFTAPVNEISLVWDSNPRNEGFFSGGCPSHPQTDGIRFGTPSRTAANQIRPPLLRHDMIITKRMRHFKYIRKIFRNNTVNILLEMASFSKRPTLLLDKPTKTCYDHPVICR